MNHQALCDPHRIDLFLDQKLSEDEQCAFELDTRLTAIALAISRNQRPSLPVAGRSALLQIHSGPSHSPISFREWP